MSLKAKPLKYKKLDGISEKQLSEHHDVLYTGYVKKYNEIIDGLKSADVTSANQTYSDLRELNVEKTFALNGVKLHEAYFDGLSDQSNQPTDKIQKLIDKHFGSFDKWRTEFMSLGMAARGWVVLAYDLDRQLLENYICDAHNQGGVWNSIALIILDVYEHAYFIDYATARKSYIDAYMKNVDWHEVSARLDRFKIK